MSKAQDPKRKLSVKLIFIIVILGCFVGVFLHALTQQDTPKPDELNKDIPEFTLPNLLNTDQLITQKDIQSNAPLLVNIWASWCAPCRKEHKVLTELAQKHQIKIFGLNYKDKVENGQKFLEKYGNPFFLVVNDAKGLTTLNWGIRGVPETFVVNKDGKIIYRHTGEIRTKDVQTLLEKLN